MSSGTDLDATDDSLTDHLERALANADNEQACYHIRAALQYRYLRRERGDVDPQ